MKKVRQLITLQYFLRRTLIGFCAGLLLLLAVAGGIFIGSASSSVLSAPLVLLLGLLCMGGMGGMVYYTTRYVMHHLARPITHLIATTQLCASSDYKPVDPKTEIAEINILARSVGHMLGKILHREHRISGSEQRLSLALRGSGEGVWDWDIQENDSYIDLNCCRILDVDPEEVAINNRLWLKRLFAEDAEQARQYFRRIAAGELSSFEAEYRIHKPNPDLEYSWVQIRGSVVEWNKSGRAARMSGTVSDVTQRKIVEQQLKLYSTAFKCTKNAVVMLDKDFRVLAANKAFFQISGEQEHMIIGRSYIFQHPEISAEQFHKVIKLQISNHMEWRGEALGMRGDGTAYPQELAVYGVFDDFVNLTHYVTIFSDITERKRTEENLRVLANYDPLTGLANRYMFNATFNRSLQIARRKNEKLALLFIDLDHFKQVNDLFGHEAGDRLLIEVANRIQGSIRETDTAARLAGDEFVVILESVQTLADVEQVGMKILTALSNPAELPEGISKVSASVGVAVFPEQGNDPETLLRSADRAMYDAKMLGRNRLSICMDRDKHTLHTHQLNIDNENVS